MAFGSFTAKCVCVGVGRGLRLVREPLSSTESAHKSSIISNTAQQNINAAGIASTTSGIA